MRGATKGERKVLTTRCGHCLEKLPYGIFRRLWFSLPGMRLSNSNVWTAPCRCPYCRKHIHGPACPKHPTCASAILLRSQKMLQQSLDATIPRHGYGSPSGLDDMAWERIVQAGYLIQVSGLPPMGYTTSLAGAHFLRQLTTSPLRLFWERNWFPVVIAIATVLSNAIALYVIFNPPMP